MEQKDQGIVAKFEHPGFKSGTKVYIDPAISETHDECPLADRVAQVCQGIIYKNTQLEEINGMVPVSYRGTTYYVQERFVTALPPRLRP